MPIVELTDSTLTQRCAKCSAERTLPLDELTLGAARDEQADGSVLPLPTCEACGAGEFLIGSRDDDPEHPAPGSFGHLHRLLVDHLQSELVTRGRVIPALRSARAGLARRPLSASAQSRWFPNGLRLEPELTDPPNAKEKER